MNKISNKLVGNLANNIYEPKGRFNSVQFLLMTMKFQIKKTFTTMLLLSLRILDINAFLFLRFHYLFFLFYIVNCPGNY